MKKEVKDLWVEALKSGEYIQGHQYLNIDNSFCCLGVLCEVAIKSGLALEKTFGGGYYVYGEDSYNMLPQKVMEWAGMRSRAGEFSSSSLYRHPKNSLWALNDVQRYSFEQLAAVIEESWEQL